MNTKPSLPANWVAKTLSAALSANDGYTCQVEGEALVVTLRKHQDLTLMIAISGDYMLVETPLFPVSAVTDKAELNELLLRGVKGLPLSSVAIDNMMGEDTYVLVGELSSSTLIENIELEIETMAANYFEVVETVQDYLKA